MNAHKKDENVVEWFLMDIPDSDTDKQAQQEIVEFSNVFLQTECKINENDKNLLLTNNSNVIIIDFYHPTEDPYLNITNTLSCSRTLRSRISNSNNTANKTLADHVISNNTPEPIDNSFVEPATPNIPDPVINRQWRKNNGITAIMPNYEKRLGYKVIYGNYKTTTDILS